MRRILIVCRLQATSGTDRRAPNIRDPKCWGRTGVTGPKNTCFCVHEDELFMSANELFLVNGQTLSAVSSVLFNVVGPYNDFDNIILYK